MYSWTFGTIWEKWECCENLLGKYSQQVFLNYQMAFSFAAFKVKQSAIVSYKLLFFCPI